MASIIAYFLSTAGIIIIGTLVLFRRQKKVFTWFGYFCFSIAFWLIAQYFVGQSSYIYIWLGLSFLFSEVVVATLMNFAFLYPSKNKVNSKVFVFSVLPLLVCGPFSFSALMYSRHSVDASFSVDHLGAMYVPQTIVVVLYLILSLLILFIRMLHISAKEKMQMRILIVAFMIPLVTITLTGLLFVNSHDLEFIRPFSLLCMVALITYAMVYRGLFDIRFFVARAATYLVTLGFLAFIYGFIVLGVARVLLDIPISTTSQLILAAMMGGIAYSFEKIHKRFDTATNKFFYRDAYSTEDFLASFNDILVSSYDVSVVTQKVSNLINEYVRPTWIVFGLTKTDTSNEYRIVTKTNIDTSSINLDSLKIIASEARHTVLIQEGDESVPQKAKQDLAKFDIAAFITLNPKNLGTNFGFIALGYKKSGNQYNKSDRKVFEVMANELSIALQNALHYEEIQQFNETLQQKVEDATAKLRVTNEKLRKMDETKDEFISMASHQLRTPLTSVKGYVSMVLDGDVGPINDQQRELLNQSFMSSQRMANLISDLLNLSRINTGKFVIEPAPVDLRNIVEAELAQLREMAEGKDITLVYEPPETYPVAMLDDGKMHQVVMNLIDNAIYYTPAGGVVTVLVEETPTSLEFRVVDSGIGVPREAQRHLFGKMFRAANAKRARPDGTGLGLFMVKKVIISQGGAIIFDSVEGKGSTFGFYFPKKTVLAPEGTEAITSRGQVRSEQ